MKVYIDGSFLSYRSLTDYLCRLGYNDKDGDWRPTGTLVSFLQSLSKICQRFPQAEEIGIVWDSKPIERKKIDPKYKETRKKDKDEEFYRRYRAMKKQMKELRVLLSFAGLRQYYLFGREADDLLASFASQKDGQIILIVRDKDLYQTITKEVSLYDLEEVKDYKWFREEYGIEPIDWILVQSLMGDSTDNIQGVQGIGIKTALSLVRSYGNLEKVLSSGNIDDEDKQIVRLAKKLVTLRTNLNLSKALISPRSDWRRFASALKRRKMHKTLVKIRILKNFVYF